MNKVKRKIVLAFDSFKGSLSSREVADAFAAGLEGKVPPEDIIKLSIADGGEGTVDALVSNLCGTLVKASVHGPSGAPVEAIYSITEQGTAIMEMAAASGITLIPPRERNPMLTSSYGTGEMVGDALERGCRRFIMGIGGSATNDAGTGMLRALGYRFLDKNGRPLEGGGAMLTEIVTIDDTHAHKALRDAEFLVACDVDTPLYGTNGAAYLFAPQKGADATMVEQLDKGLRNFASAVKAYNGCDVSTIKGGGAAGGMGAGFVSFLNARLKSGVEVILDAVGFADILDNSACVFTGEGCLDNQTLLGKAPCGVLQVARAKGVPVYAVGGSVAPSFPLCNNGFEEVYTITPEGMPLELAMRHDVAWENVRALAHRLSDEEFFNILK